MNKPDIDTTPIETPAETAKRVFEEEIDVVDEEEAEETEQIKAELEEQAKGKRP